MIWKPFTYRDSAAMPCAGQYAVADIPTDEGDKIALILHQVDITTEAIIGTSLIATNAIGPLLNLEAPARELTDVRTYVVLNPLLPSEGLGYVPLCGRTIDSLCPLVDDVVRTQPAAIGGALGQWLLDAIGLLPEAA